MKLLISYFRSMIIDMRNSITTPANSQLNNLSYCLRIEAESVW